MSFLFELEKDGKMSFLDVETSQENAIFVTSIYRKPTFSSVYTRFERFLPSTHKFGMLYSLDINVLLYAQIGQSFKENF